MARRHRFERTLFIPKPREEVFRFFSDASNLERLTPRTTPLRILTPQPIEMRPGVVIDYELKIAGVPMRWTARIESFEPSQFFTDVQLKGPYRSWHHRHAFSDVPGGTQMQDCVDYELPLGLLGSVAQWLFVHRMLRRIFDYRERVLSEVFASSPVAKR